MQYLLALLPTLLKWFTGFAIAKFFVSLAVGIFTYSIIQYFFDQYINSAMQQIGYMGDVAALIGISQLDTALSIVMGALSIRAFILSTKMALGKG
ncbi:DUF2523 family protein [Moraxella lincolnii]|uniref:DUF2523 domain-containing protein n=1 Tax=Lwoffella lincolnii TaxID=90241 RepID=A0A1T0CHI7_9GAMM|nr:DUF2523 family protein [Moraxella lincolnii]OOS21601.1 hypothetical protein B0682_02670 [Moraxella lincolnii]